MRRALLLFGVLPITALAAPVPPLSEKELIAKYWGTIHAPSAKYEFQPSRDGKALKIHMAGEPVMGLGAGEYINMPRATRTVTGDFEMTVKVVDASAPNLEVKRSDSDRAMTRAGLIMSGGGYGIELYLSQCLMEGWGWRDKDMRRQINVDSYYPARGARAMELSKADANQAIDLRITRIGKDVTVCYSFDGKEWSKPFAHRKYEFPDEVTVGVSFAQSTYQMTTATFSDFTILQSPKR